MILSEFETFLYGVLEGIFYRQLEGWDGIRDPRCLGGVSESYLSSSLKRRDLLKDFSLDDSLQSLYVQGRVHPPGRMKDGSRIWAIVFKEEHYEAIERKRDHTKETPKSLERILDRYNLKLVKKGPLLKISPETLQELMHRAGML